MPATLPTIESLFSSYRLQDTSSQHLLELCTVYNVDPSLLFAEWELLQATDPDMPLEVNEAALDKLSRKLASRKTTVKQEYVDQYQSTIPSIKAEPFYAQSYGEEQSTENTQQAFLGVTRAPVLKMTFNEHVHSGLHEDAIKTEAAEATLRIMNPTSTTFTYQLDLIEDDWKFIQSRIQKVTKRILSKLNKGLDIEDQIVLHSVASSFRQETFFGGIILHAEPVQSAPNDTQETDKWHLKLDPTRIWMQTEEGYKIRLEMSAVHDYSVFPGQVVIVRGLNVNGDELRVLEFFDDGNEFEQRDITETSEMDSEINSEESAVTFMIASGPFSMSSSIDYSVLDAFMNRVMQFEPDFVILTGPFVDVSHRSTENLVEMTYEDLFEFIIAEYVLKKLPSRSQLVLIPSVLDANHEFSFPQGPYKMSMGLQKQLEASKAYLAPNPATLEVNNGFSLGLLGGDLLREMAKSEFSVNRADRMSTLCSHLLKQSSYFPVFPPVYPSDFLLELSKDCSIDTGLNLLIVPSALTHFVREVNGVICMNPGVIVRRDFPGTFAEVTFRGKGRVRVDIFGI